MIKKIVFSILFLSFLMTQTFIDKVMSQKPLWTGSYSAFGFLHRPRQISRRLCSFFLVSRLCARYELSSLEKSRKRLSVAVPAAMKCAGRQLFEHHGESTRRSKRTRDLDVSRAACLP